jgi:hypothetical protein
VTASNSIGEPDPSPAGEANALADVLLSSLETLATAGHADEACRLAGRACAATRLTDMRTWRKFNALLHRLARHVQ